MKAGVDESSVKTFEYDNFSMEVQKRTKQEFAEKGENQISLKTDSDLVDLQVKIPFDPLFADVENIIFAASHTGETGSHQLFSKRQHDYI